MKDKETGATITPTCRTFGHDIKFQDGDDFEATLGHDGGVHRVVKGYYSGRLYYCGRDRCEWQEFKGEKKPHHMVVYDHRKNTIEEYKGHKNGN